MKKNKTDEPLPAFKLGAISLAFLLLGYQVALFVQKAAITGIVAHRDRPDTVYVYVKEDGGGAISDSVRRVRPAASSPAARIAEKYSVRRVESFRFNPNTASADDLERLGFSSKQASAIVNYRKKGGRFRRKQDFAKSFVVSDSVYRRLEHFIDIPLLDINKADSADFDALPGIGPYFASAMVRYRESLGGYSCKEQLLEVSRMDTERYSSFEDLVCCSPPRDSFALWTLSADELKAHPHIRSAATARSIVFYREHNPVEEWTVAGLKKAGILTDEAAGRLERCAIKGAR